VPLSDVAIIGAGPYGLSAAAHLSTIKGLEVRVFGDDPMSFWDRNMPAGMFLRSAWTATEISAPGESLSLEAFQAASGRRFASPVPLDCFIEYGRWYQSRAVPDLDRRKVVQVEFDPAGFRIVPETGDAITARNVVIAAGIGSFARRPPEFSDFPPSLASHASEHRDLRIFSGKDVLVLGALESAALLREGGAAKVEVFGRAHEIHWLQGRLSKFLHVGAGGLVRRFFYAPTDVGPAGLSQLLARPDLLRQLPRGLQDKLRKRAVRPAGARWLVPRLVGVPIRLGRTLVSASAAGDKVKVKFDDSSERTVDHVLLGTGYRPDISKYAFLSRALVERIDRFNGYPRLRPGLETSVPGLYIVGAPAAWSFGPLMQFVSGTRYACPAVTRSIAKKGRA